ncbi:Ig-like domain-containing protein [Hyalangium sp.]|uniref:Ig-like domain-containing protein n=1 Tax=Hyalangium sp. TaxID=2028555 RepID=UPI002D348D2B|nr:Ig-like domain-containing protein [Hyalangium sp.]HYH98634.1 Ig-like domain-containing protein [Hyalangium sp.]
MRELRLGLLQSWRVWSCAVALLGLGATSCGSEEEPPPPGQVDVEAPSRIDVTGGVRAGAFISGETTLDAVAEDNSGRVAKVSFFVGGVLACADGTARDSGATFSCVWDTSNTLPGDYQLLATAQDAAGNTKASVPIAFSVGDGLPPTISGLGANPTSVNEGQNTSLSVTASDPNGDTLTYAWSQVSPASPAGTFTNGGTAAPTWTAPLLSANTTFTLRVTVSDGHGGTAQRTVDLQVVNVASANRAPVVDAAITAPPTALAGDTAALSIGATDPDGDPLTYSWRTSPSGSGTFSNEDTASASWRSGDTGADTNQTLQVTVSDGVASVTRSVTVRVTVPRYGADIQPIWNQVCTSCHDNTSPSGGMNLLAGSSHSSMVGVNGINRCGGSFSIQRVRVNQPNSSLLVRKIEGSTCGNRMPRNDTAYFVNNPGFITRIRSWILGGALNN